MESRPLRLGGKLGKRSLKCFRARIEELNLKGNFGPFWNGCLVGMANGVFEPDWDGTQGWSAQGVVVLRANLFRILWFLLFGFFDVLALLWTIHRCVQASRKKLRKGEDPGAELEGWRKWAWQLAQAGFACAFAGSFAALASCSLFADDGEIPVAPEPEVSFLGTYSGARVDTLRSDTLWVALDTVNVVTPCFLDSIVAFDSLSVPDSVPVDTLPIDTLPADTIPADSIVREPAKLFVWFSVHLTRRGGLECPMVAHIDTTLPIPWRSEWNIADTIVLKNPTVRKNVARRVKKKQ
jgi:hypothetical protein